ncbi:MAG: hypothetical protein RIS70_3012 [Planctomycetota bacterium]|jgi:YegS/Rv2252/BmrU family lipid kinase
MRVCVIYNPRVVSDNMLAQLLPRNRHDPTCELWPTDGPNDAQRLAQLAVQRQYDRVVVAGGDGTVGQAVQGIVPDCPSMELGILPFGTGNDLARSLGINPELLGLASSYAFGTRTAPLDLIRLSDTSPRYCINVANGGFGGRVANDVQSIDKQRWGALAYWMTSVIDLVYIPEFSIELSIDDQPPIYRTVIGVAIANGKFVGGGFPIAPQAIMNDGWLDVILIPPLPSFDLMTTGLGFMLGFEQLAASVDTYRARRVQLRSNPPMPFSIDGELAQCDEMTFEIVPAALQVLIGDYPAAIDESRLDVGEND